MQYITSGNRIAVENFTVGYLYTITFTGGEYIHCACTGIGMDFVMFSRTAPEYTFALTMETAEDVSSIDLYSEGGGTTNYNDLTNKPQVNGIELVGNKSLNDLGIQPVITDDNKLSYTLISGLGTAATTASSDYATAAQGALADSAVQPADMNSALSTKQNLINSDNMLSADLVDDASSTNKFATAAELQQIETNKTNILYNTNNGVKNLAPLNTATTANTGYFGNTSVNLPADTYIISFKLTSTGSFGLGITVDGSDIAKNSTSPPYSNTLITHEITANSSITEYKFYANGGATVTDFMICPKSLYDADPSYQPYAMSNVELTAETSNLIDSTYGTIHNVDLDTLTKGGRYLVNGAESSTSNAPFANWQTVEVYESNLDGYTTLTVQIATELGAGLSRKFRRRTYSGGGQYSAWTTWSS